MDREINNVHHDVQLILIQSQYRNYILMSKLVDSTIDSILDCCDVVVYDKDISNIIFEIRALLSELSEKAQKMETVVMEKISKDHNDLELDCENLIKKMRMDS